MNYDKITATGNKDIFLKTSYYPVPLENPITFWGTVNTFLILQESTLSNLIDNGNFGFPTMEN